MFKVIENEEEKNIFIELKLKEIKYHLKYAEALGLDDQFVKKFSKKKALKNYGKNGYYQLLLVYINNIVGIIEFKECISEIDNLPYIFLENIYIDEGYRKHGLGKKAIIYLREKYNRRIELEAWYGIPATKLYEELGMKTIKTRYMLP
jgi:ribosomal protein S18 acetylase RimI-like enzyme